MSQGALKQFYSSRKWLKVRELALQRDNYFCQKCLKENKITSADVVHHVLEIDEYNLQEYGLDLNNLVSWCRNCHESHHGRLTEEEDDYYFDADGQIVPKRKE